MSRKNQIKRLARTLMKNGVPPLRAGLAPMIAGMGLRFRSVERAMVKREEKRNEKGPEVPMPWTDRWVEKAPETRRAMRMNHSERHSFIGWLKRRGEANAVAKAQAAMDQPIGGGL